MNWNNLGNAVIGENQNTKLLCNIIINYVQNSWKRNRKEMRPLGIRIMDDFYFPRSTLLSLIYMANSYLK